MMFSATDFLPESIRVLTNLATSTLPYFGSGRISRFGTSRRRGISIPFDLQLSLQYDFFLPARGQPSRLSTYSTHVGPIPNPPVRGGNLITSCRPWRAWRRTSSGPAYGP